MDTLTVEGNMDRKNSHLEVGTKPKLYISEKQDINMGYDKTILKAYIDAMLGASEKIREENPDYLVAPMSGSIPFIDAMTILDKDFDPSKTVYMPASSRIKDIGAISREWYFNFLKDVVSSPHIFPKILGIDEVVSGQSVVRCFKSIDLASQQMRKEIEEDLVQKIYSHDMGSAISALSDADILTEKVYASKFVGMIENVKAGIYQKNKALAQQDSSELFDIVKTDLKEKLVYKTIGIEDSKKKNRSREYNGLINDGRVIPVSLINIITMDNPDYMTAQFEQLSQPKEKDHIVQFGPVVKEFKVTPEYLAFLTNLANYVGRNPNDAMPMNMNAILDSKKYLPSKCTGKNKNVQDELF